MPPTTSTSSLPAWLYVKDVPGRGRGLFTSIPLAPHSIVLFAFPFASAIFTSACTKTCPVCFRYAGYHSAKFTYEGSCCTHGCEKIFRSSLSETLADITNALKSRENSTEEVEDFMRNVKDTNGLEGQCVRTCPPVCPLLSHLGVRDVVAAWEQQLHDCVRRLRKAGGKMEQRNKVIREKKERREQCVERQGLQSLSQSTSIATASLAAARLSSSTNYPKQPLSKGLASMSDLSSLHPLLEDVWDGLYPLCPWDSTACVLSNHSHHCSSSCALHSSQPLFIPDEFDVGLCVLVLRALGRRWLELACICSQCGAKEGGVDVAQREHNLRECEPFNADNKDKEERPHGVEKKNRVGQGISQERQADTAEKEGDLDQHSGQAEERRGPSLASGPQAPSFADVLAMQDNEKAFYEHNLLRANERVHVAQHPSLSRLVCCYRLIRWVEWELCGGTSGRGSSRLDRRRANRTDNQSKEESTKRADEGWSDEGPRKEEASQTTQYGCEAVEAPSVVEALAIRAGHRAVNMTITTGACAQHHQSIPCPSHCLPAPPPPPAALFLTGKEVKGVERTQPPPLLPALLGPDSLLFRTIVFREMANAFGVWEPGDNDPGMPGYSGRECLGVAMYPHATFFNHNCNPNVRRSDTYGTHACTTFVTLREVAAGEELTIGYCDLSEKVEVRRDYLRSNFFFFCACERCKSEAREM